MCDERGITLTINTNVAYMLIYLHTDDSGTGRRSRGLNVTFTAIGKYFSMLFIDYNYCNECTGVQNTHRYMHA